MELSVETITVPEKSLRPNIFATFQRNRQRSQPVRGRPRILRRQRRSFGRGMEPGRENDIPKRDYRTAKGSTHCLSAVDRSSYGLSGLMIPEKLLMRLAKII